MVSRIDNSNNRGVLEDIIYTLPQRQLNVENTTDFM